MFAGLQALRRFASFEFHLFGLCICAPQSSMFTAILIDEFRVIAVSAHSAYEKAAQYFKITVRRAPVGADLKVDVKAVKKLINRHTIMVSLCFMKEDRGWIFVDRSLISLP